METEQKRAKAKSKYHLFGGFYCAELEAVCCSIYIHEILKWAWLPRGRFRRNGYCWRSE